MSSAESSDRCGNMLSQPTSHNAITAQQSAVTIVLDEARPD